MFFRVYADPLRDVQQDPCTYCSECGREIYLSPWGEEVPWNPVCEYCKEGDYDRATY